MQALLLGAQLFYVLEWNCLVFGVGGFSFFPVGGNREGEGGKKSYTEEAF